MRRHIILCSSGTVERVVVVVVAVAVAVIAVVVVVVVLVVNLGVYCKWNFWAAAGRTSHTHCMRYYWQRSKLLITNRHTVRNTSVVFWIIIIIIIRRVVVSYNRISPDCNPLVADGKLQHTHTHSFNSWIRNYRIAGEMQFKKQENLRT